MYEVSRKGNLSGTWHAEVPSQWGTFWGCILWVSKALKNCITCVFKQLSWSYIWPQNWFHWLGTSTCQVSFFQTSYTAQLFDSLSHYKLYNIVVCCSFLSFVVMIIYGYSFLNNVLILMLLALLENSWSTPGVYLSKKWHCCFVSCTHCLPCILAKSLIIIFVTCYFNQWKGSILSNLSDLVRYHEFSP